MNLIWEVNVGKDGSDQGNDASPTTRCFTPTKYKEIPKAKYNMFDVVKFYDEHEELETYGSINGIYIKLNEEDIPYVQYAIKRSHLDCDHFVVDETDIKEVFSKKNEYTGCRGN